MTRSVRWRLFAASAAAVAWGSQQAKAFERSWNSFSSGTFTDSTKWVGGAVPGTNDTAVFRVFGSNPGPYTVTFPGRPVIIGPSNFVNDQLRIGANTVTFNFQSTPAFIFGSYTLNSGIFIGDVFGDSVLNENLTLLAAPTASIGFLAPSPGTLNVTGGAFNVTGSSSAYELIVGDVAPGSLSVNNGAQMTLTGGESNAVIGNSAGVSGTVSVSGAGSIWNNNSNSVLAPLAVGGFGNGTLNITAGGQVNDMRSYVGSEAGSSGTVLVDGANSAWNHRELLIVGQNGAGTLTISNGGQVNATTANVALFPTSSGTVRVTGAGSTWTINDQLIVGGTLTQSGSSGSGVLLISGGGQVVTVGDGFIGSAGSGRLSIDGVGSKWSVFGETRVDRNGRASITAGGRLSSVGAFDEASVTISGAGSAWDASDYLIVSTQSLGGTSPASLTLGAGGRVSNRVGYVGGGLFPGGGSVFMSDPGSTWNSAEQLFVGFVGTGDFVVTDGAQLTSGAAQIGVSVNSVGTVTVNGAGSTWSNPGSLFVGAGGSGLLTVSNGGVATIGGGVSIGLRGTVEGNSTVAANVQNSGTVAPGVAGNIVQDGFIGTLRFNGNYAQSAVGKLKVELASTSLFDKLLVGGNAALDGTIQVTLVNNFTPVAGDRFTVLSAAQRTGVFQPTASIGPIALFLVPVYTPTDVIIMAVAGGEKTWAVDASGNSSVPDNWFGGVPSAAGVDDKVAFSTMITVNRTVTVDSPFAAGSIYFDGSKSYTVAGPGLITLDSSTGGAALSVKSLHGAAAHVISAPVVLNDSTKIDVAANAALTITQPMSIAAGAGIEKNGQGDLEVKNIRADIVVIKDGTLRVLKTGGALGTSVVKSLTIMPVAKFDLNNNDLLVDYTGTTPYPTIRNYLLNGLNIGEGGITSTVGQGDGRAVHALVDNSHLHLTSWNGLAIDDSTIIAKFTLRGDATLDGTVNFFDLVKVAQNYNNATGQATWDIGDFNYDGNVNFVDLVALAQNYNGVVTGEAIPGAAEGFDGDVSAAFASVPEPSALCALILLGASRMPRKRRVH